MNVPHHFNTFNLHTHGMDDPKIGTEWRDRLIQLRSGATHALIFPCPDDRVLCLFMSASSWDA